MSQFTFQTTPRIRVEDGVSGRLGEELKALGARHAMVVTDAFLARSGLLDAALASLATAGVALTLYDRVEADPAVL